MTNYDEFCSNVMMYTEFRSSRIAQHFKRKEGMKQGNNKMCWRGGVKNGLYELFNPGCLLISGTEMV